MSYSGHNISSQSGANIPPSIDETIRTATHANLQINLNIQPGLDSVDTGHQTKIHEDDRKYQSQPNRPLLPPVHTKRTSGPQIEARPRDDWKGKFDELVDHLPEDLKNYFKEEQKLPDDQRLPSLLIMERVYEMVAKFMVLLEQAAAPEGAGTVREALRELNLIVPEVKQRGLHEAGGESVKYIRQMLDQIARNNPHYDHINLNLQKTEDALKRMDILREGDHEG